MGLCYAPDCNHTNKNACKMFKFPTDVTLMKKWEKLLRSDRTPTKFSVVCSCHFKNGEKENLPTIFDHNHLKLFKFSSPEKPKRKNIDPNEVLAVNLVSESINASSNISSQVESSSNILQAENYFLKQEITMLQTKLQNLKLSFGIEHIQENNKLLLMYTGLPQIGLFNKLFDLLNQFDIAYYSNWEVQKISKENQLLLCLMKLKLNLLHEDLAVRFGISSSSITNIFLTWLDALHYVLFENMLLKRFPSSAKNETCMPSAFSSFTNCRIVLDCTEVYTAVPTRLDKQRATYSSYKHRNTLKGLVGVSPNGTITFLSKLYGGNTSDKKIVERSNVLNVVQAGDLILADKGFLISDILPAGVSLNIPPFLVQSQFTVEEINRTTAIARARIHVERAIQRIKIFKILHSIPAKFRPNASKIFQVCGCLANFNFPLLKELEPMYNL
ncbi:hypothetical protein RI129_007758 [Pyrocoelia pectoralis]|uniref:THAP-type domain-containing protein n=1 Tax=Pyrocoelia pectoralis TaxID=417401 RepID=A0AAN7ZLR1_9COLE